MQYMLPLLNMQAPQNSKQQQQKLIAKVSISILVMSLPVLYVSFLRIPPAALFRDTTFWFLMSNSIIIIIAADSGMLFFGSSSSSSSAAAYDHRPFVVYGEPAVVKNSHASMVVSDDELLPVVIKNQELAVQDHGDVVVTKNSHSLVVKGEEDDVNKPENRETMMISPSSASSAADLDAGEAVAIKNVDGPTVQASRPRLTASKRLVEEERARSWRRSRSHSNALVAVPVEDKSVVVREEKLRRTATEGRPRPVEESEYERLSDEDLNRRVEEFITRFNREIRLQMEKEQA